MTKRMDEIDDDVDSEEQMDMIAVDSLTGVPEDVQVHRAMQAYSALEQLRPEAYEDRNREKLFLVRALVFVSVFCVVWGIATIIITLLRWGID